MKLLVKRYRKSVVRCENIGTGKIRKDKMGWQPRKVKKKSIGIEEMKGRKRGGHQIPSNTRQVGRIS